MNILLNFYMVHTNIAAVLILIFMLEIFFLTKKNFKGLIIATIILIIANVVIFNKTNNKLWERQYFANDEYKTSFLVYDKISKDTNNIEFRDSMKVSFAANSKNYPWVTTATKINEKDKKLHWCWVDDYWERFSKLDLVNYIWGGSATKNMRISSEKRLEGN